MNKTMTSLITLGIGAYAFRMAQQNDLMSSRPMRKLRKRVSKMM
jgi:hypothetical protein